MSIKEKYSGVIVPMVTPFKDDYSIDEQAVENLISNFITAGVIPFVLGTTGESESMSLVQKEELVKTTIKFTKEKCKLFAGISGNSFYTSVEQAKKYAGFGVDAVVATVPYYYPMDNYQLMTYFTNLADSVPRPLIIYNMPSTTGVSIPLVIIDKLSNHPNIIGIKDSERDKERMDTSLELWKNRTDFVYLIGWAAMSVYGLQNGADGIVPGSGNFCPGLYQNLFDETRKGNINRANELQEKTNYLSSLYQKERDLSHSIPALKVILSTLKLCGTQVMPPMYKMGKEEEKQFERYISKELENIDLKGKND